jgi:hypothetical protein
MFSELEHNYKSLSRNSELHHISLHKNQDAQSINNIRQERHCTSNNIEARSRNYCCRWNAKSFPYSECDSVGLVIHCAVRMRSVICHLWLVWLYHLFPCFMHGTIFGGEKILNIKYVFWVSLQIFLKYFSF